jgi:hypothetical protein
MCVTIARTGAPETSAAVRGLIDGVDISMEITPARDAAKESRLA